MRLKGGRALLELSFKLVSGPGAFISPKQQQHLEIDEITVLNTT